MVVLNFRKKLQFFLNHFGAKMQKIGRNQNIKQKREKIQKKEKGIPTGPIPEPSKAACPQAPLPLFLFLFYFLFSADRWDPPVRAVFNVALITPVTMRSDSSPR
jgi:hypothetical protein